MGLSYWRKNKRCGGGENGEFGVMVLGADWRYAMILSCMCEKNFKEKSWHIMNVRKTKTKGYLVNP